MEKANKKAAAQGKSQNTTTAVERKPRSVSKSADKKAAGAKKDQSKGRRSDSKGKQADQGKKAPQDKKAADKRKSSKSQKRDASKKRGKEGKEVSATVEDNTMKPTRALSAYIFYSNETVPKLKKEGIDHRAAMSKAGELWGKLTDAEKKKFNDLHEKDQVRYENQKKELKEKGYFILDDGSKSSDHQVQGKKKASKSEKKEAKSAVKKRGSAAAVAAVEPKKAATAKKPAGKKGKLNQTVDEDEQHSKVEESD